MPTGRPIVIGARRGVRAGLPLAMHSALEHYVALTGEARSSVVRRGVAQILAEAGFWNLDANAPLPVTLTSDKDPKINV